MNFWGAGLLAAVLAIQETPIITGDCRDETLDRLAIAHGRYLKSLWASTEIKTGQDLAFLIQEEDRRKVSIGEQARPQLQSQRCKWR